MVVANGAGQERQRRVARHAAADGGRKLVVGEPDPRLRGHVLAYHGYAEEVPQGVRGWELPSTEIPLIINLGPAYRLSNAAQPSRWVEHGSFLAGLHDVAAYHESTGSAHCLQVNFTPLGAYRFFGVPMGELVNRVVGLDDVVGQAARSLEERLYAAPSWAARFAIMDGVIAARIGAARPVQTEVVWAWRQIEDAGGCVAVATLAEELGWSRKHLGARFLEQVGLPPKQVARIVRFNRAVRALDRVETTGWADLAHRCGYYDQSHLIRDVRDFAGCTPSALLVRRRDGLVPIGDGG